MKLYRLLPVFVVACLLITGCGQNDIKKMEIASDALEKKYEEPFTVFEVQNNGEGGFYAWAYPENNPNLKLKADLSKDGSAFADNYPVRLMCDSISEKAAEYLSYYPGDYYIFTENTLEYTKDEGKDITIQQHTFTNPGDSICVEIYASRTNVDFQSLYNAVARMKMSLGITNGYIEVNAVTDKQLAKVRKEIEKYDHIDSDNLSKIIEHPYCCVINTSTSMPSYKEFVGELESNELENIHETF